MHSCTSTVAMRWTYALLPRLKRVARLCLQGDEDVAGQQQQQAGAGDRVVVSAGRGPSAGAARRYAAGGSVSASAASLGAGQGAQGPGGGGGAGDDGYGEVPGTPASVASGGGEELKRGGAG